MTARLLPMVVLAGVLVGGAAWAGAARAATPTGEPSTTGQPSAAAGPSIPAEPITFTISDIRPRAPRPGDSLQVLGTVRNTGPQPLLDLQLRVRVGNRLTTRGDLRQSESTPPTYRDPHSVQPLADLPAGAEAPLDLRAEIDDLRLGADGVYPLQVEVRGLRGSSGTREQLGQVSTYLPWFGSTTVDPLRIAWVLPVVDQPRQTPADAPAETLVDDTLAGSLTPTGRPGRTLAAGRAGESGDCPPAAEPPTAEPPAGQAPTANPTTANPPTANPPTGATGAPPGASPPTCSPVPVTYAVDPDLLQTVQGMTRPYDVLTLAGSTSRPASSAAAGWLSGLAAATAAGDVLALPYADPDVVALTRGAADLAADVTTARAYGVTVTHDVLGRDPVQTVAYPPDGRLSDAAFDALTTGSTQAVVLSDDAVSAPASGARSTPGARVGLPPSLTSGTVTGLVVDRGLSDLLVPTHPEDARLAEQRWLVETAMISAELPSRGRTILVAAPRRAGLDPAVVGADIADTGRVPWMCPVRLADVAAGRERCASGAIPSYAPDRSAALLQPDPRAPSLSSEQLAQVSQVRADATQLTGAVIQGGTAQAEALRADLQRAWLRAESSAWQEQRAAGARLVALVRQDVADLRGKVSVLTGHVTLTSNNGRVSVAVVNGLGQPVTVALRLRAPSDATLSRGQTGVLVVPARNLSSVEIDASTLTSGRFVVKAQLLDRNGAPFGQPKDLVVHSTRYGRVALAVTGLGVAVLLVAAGVRLARRALRRPVSP